MNQSLKTLARQIVFAALFFVATSTAAKACQACLAEKSLTLVQSIEQADLIVIGTRIFDKTDSTEPAKIKIQLGTVLRGAVADNQITVESYRGMCPYGVVIEDDAKYLLILRDSNKDGVYEAVATCSQKALKVTGADETVSYYDKLDEQTIALPKLIIEQIAPPAYRRAWEFLLYLKSTADGDGAGYNKMANGKWKVDEVMKYVSPNGLMYSDVNVERGRVRQITAAALRRELTAKRGNAANLFAHFGYIYSQPYPQYSTLSYQPAKNGVVINVSFGFRLTFTKENSLLQLTKLEYLTLEGD